ncbi:spore germination protein GerPE [Paenibacillus tarimensis]
MARTSKVRNIYMYAVSLSSTFFVGDMVEFRPVSRALAVQREEQLFYGNEGNFEAYPLFSKPIPQPVIDGHISMQITNISPYIYVDNIKIMGASAASLVQIGSSHRIDSESRIKHFRQLREE